MKRFFAFTLAETLIVIGIIGIVSALTLPNLNASTGEKEKVAKVKKLYQNLTDAYGRATVVYGPMKDWPTSNFTTVAGDRISEFLKVTKNCGITNTGNCFASANTKSNGGSRTAFRLDTETKLYKFILADGSSVGITSDNSANFYPPNLISGPTDTTSHLMFIVDIDGPNKGKNTFGYDLHQFMTWDPNDTQSSYYRELKAYPGAGFSNMLTSCFGEGCTAWVIEADNMDYIEAGITNRCKNGKSLGLTTNITCK